MTSFCSVCHQVVPLFRSIGIDVVRHCIFLTSASVMSLGLLAAPCAWAQSGNISGNEDFADMSLKELTEMEVFSSAASLIPIERAKAPGTVYSFDREDFVRLGVRRLDDLLAYLPGFQLVQNRKRHRAIWARGMIDRYNDKYVLLVDGIRRQHVYYGNISLGDNFPLEKIEKVEVILGPASSLYGANAYGGIISVTTRDYTKNQHIEATAEGGDNGRGKGTLLYNSEKLQAFGSYLSQDAPFREDRRSFIGGDTVEPLGEDYTNLFFKASPIEGLTVTADYYRNNTPFLFIPNTQDSFVDEDSLTLAALYEKGDLDHGKIQANFYYNWDMAKEYEIENQLRSLAYEEHQDAAMAGSTVTGFKRLFDDHVVALGFNWMHTAATNMDFERRFHFADSFLNPPKTGSLLSDPNVSNDDYAVFLQDVWSIIPRLDLTLGGRFDYFEQFGSHFNYRAALVYTPDERQTIKLLYGTAIRTPTFREYLKVLDGTDFVAPVPDPEQLATVEIGYLYQWERSSLNITLFHNDVEHYIHETPTPDGKDEYFANSEPHWHMNGVEALLQFRPLDALELRLSGAYLNAKEAGIGELPYLSTWTGNFTMNYRYLDEHRLGFSLFFQSDRSDTNRFNDDNPDAFLIANIFGSGRVSRNLSYAYGVDNVFDSRVYDPAADFGTQFNTERSGREIWGRITWSFNP
ncbi:MAG: TonB-dependent receptor plug domain-containing protein [Gammaproteobacteria bacterium]